MPYHVITYQTPSGDLLPICKAHRRALEGRPWPKNVAGEEYCQVYRGETKLGECYFCSRDSKSASSDDAITGSDQDCTLDCDCEHNCDCYQEREHAED